MRKPNNPGYALFTADNQFVALCADKEEVANAVNKNPAAVRLLYGEFATVSLKVAVVIDAPTAEASGTALKKDGTPKKKPGRKPRIDVQQPRIDVQQPRIDVQPTGDTAQQDQVPSA